ncbi:glycosyltransferase family 2 protein [Psychromarinibacter sp. C21-152]|uniref:Glycosyltransferase family 2 protein n=1 Tax=Psychromarinibacter sediminicola TaxID=3033385 RepID=A0AAE3NQ74_9RHOB|nr:glycosyltransferase family 2 protein [Psychromarinibacter sediminicola]MDF0599654.1 glycosyltransferase family 2 protein [Psychromarinibacter sediminicola]
MPDDLPVFLRRRLTSGAHGALRVIEALRWPSPFGSAVRIWFAQGARPEMVKPGAAAGEMHLKKALVVGANLIVTGEAPAGDGPLRAAFAAGAADLDTAAPETGLFDGMAVLLAQRHREPAETVARWLGYHVDSQGADAALILDRAPDDAGFADALERLTAAMPGLKRLVVVSCALPLGGAKQPALGDPRTAPRRWGEPAAPDPWRAPLGEPLVYDALKWRFLARARAVAALDPCDLAVAAPGAATVFDRVAATERGVLALAGEPVYPWRLRKGQRPAHGDHVCRLAPPGDGPARWAADPKRLGPDALWLAGGIAGQRPERADPARFDRCMSVLFPDNKVQELVDKDRLAADPRLIARAEDLFGAKPVRPPAAQAAPAPAADPLPPAPSERTVIVTCMKNEGPFLLEWLAYHRMIGVDDILVYSNDCDDGTDTLLDLLQARGLVQHRENPFRATGDKPQRAALAAAADEPVVQQAGWIVPMDVDEFINIHAGEGRLADLYAAAGAANAISMTWRLFGNADIAQYQDSPVTEQFTRCAPRLIRRPHQAWAFKTLVRNQGLFRRLAVHRPKGLNAARAHQVRWVNGSGRPMPARFLRSGWRSTADCWGYDLVTLNHYAVRSAESYLVKRRRGRVNHVAHDQHEGYWFRMNNNAEEDRSIQRHLPALRAEIDRLMADPEIAAAHRHSVARHRATIAELKTQDDYRRLYDAITSDRMRRLSRMHARFGMNVFLRGPRVIPDRVLADDLPASFVFNVAPPRGRAAD